MKRDSWNKIRKSSQEKALRVSERDVKWRWGWASLQAYESLDEVEWILIPRNDGSDVSTFTILCSSALTRETSYEIRYGRSWPPCFLNVRWLLHNESEWKEYMAGPFSFAYVRLNHRTQARELSRKLRDDERFKRTIHACSGRRSGLWSNIDTRKSNPRQWEKKHWLGAGNKKSKS